MFALLDRRLSLRQIVASEKQSPALVRELYREWLTGLADGEQARAARKTRERRRREALEDERMHTEHLQALSFDRPT